MKYLTFDTSYIEGTDEVINIDSYYEVMSKYILNNSIPVSTKILWQFSKINAVSSEVKKKMLIVCMENIDFEIERNDLQIYLKSIDGKYLDLVIHGNITTVDDDFLDNKLLELLRKKKFIQK